MTKKWRCKVCGYVHEGAEPPERCPVCGVDRTQFEPVAATVPASAPAAAVPAASGVSAEGAGKPAPAASGAPVGGQAAPGAARPRRGKAECFMRLMVKWHAHPVAAHVPNGVLPCALVLLLLGILLDREGFRQAAFYNVVFVAVAMPFVLFSGYADWKRKLKGARTPLILGKMAAGAVVMILAVGVVVWGLFGGPAESSTWPYFAAHVFMLAAAGVAGYLGGRLVFRGHEGLD